MVYMVNKQLHALLRKFHLFKKTMFTCTTGKNKKWLLTLHNDLESKSCFLCETVISHGFITSSIVTAAMALMLVETVLWTKKQVVYAICISNQHLTEDSDSFKHLKVPL